MWNYPHLTNEDFGSSEKVNNLSKVMKLINEGPRYFTKRFLCTLSCLILRTFLKVDRINSYLFPL